MSGDVDLPLATGRQLGLLGCHACGLTSPAGATHCRRCQAPLHLRKPESLARTWALVIAAAILYIPANMLPIMHTSTLLGSENDTILSGVVTLWNAGAWDLAAIVFVASIVVPLLKIGALSFLALGVQRRWRGHRPERTRLYRMLEFIGHWSMLDVFVVVLLTSLVQLQSFAQVTAGSGAVAFGAVVVLTMLASKSFDPRLIWDTCEADRD